VAISIFTAKAGVLTPSHIVSGAASGNANVGTVAGNIGFRAVSSTYTDNVSSLNATGNFAIHALAQPTLTASNSITPTNLATFYIANAPAQGTNVAATNLYALHVAAGNSFFNGNITANYYIGNGSQLTNINATTATNANAVQTNVQTTGTYYLPFVISTASTTNGNYQLNSNANFSANLANGYLTATGYVGNASGLTAIPAGNVTGTLPNATTNAISNLGTVSAGAIAGSLITGNVPNANMSYFANVTTNATTASAYIAFANGSTTSNYALQSNTAIFANFANGYLTATGYVGNASGLTAIPAGNVTGTLPNAVTNAISNVGTVSAGSIAGALITGNVANANLANVANYIVQTAQTTGTFYLALANTNTSTNVSLNANTNINVALATGTLNATLFAGSGANLTSMNAANITGTLANSVTNAISNVGTVSAGSIAGALITGNVANANMSYFANVSTNATTASAYITFANANTTSNYALQSNTAIFANLANGYITATGFVGTHVGNVIANTANGTVIANNISVSGNATGNANVSAVTGNLGFRAIFSTYTDNSAAASATIANAAIHALAAPNLAAANTGVTFTNAATFFIGGAPVANTNATITNPYSLYVAAGNSLFGAGVAMATVSGNVGVGTAAPASKFHVSGGNILLDNNNFLQQKDDAGTVRSVVGTLTDGSVSVYGYHGTPMISGVNGLTYVYGSGGTAANALSVAPTGVVSANANVTTTNSFVSTIATGTAPLVVTSTTTVANLSANYLQGNVPATAATANTIVLRDANGNISGIGFAGNGFVASGGGTGQLTVGSAAGNIGIRALQATYTDNAIASTNLGLFSAHMIRTPTYAASNTGQTGIAASFVIESAPTQGTNITFTNSYALYVGGNTNISGNLVTGNISANNSSNSYITANSITAYGSCTGAANIAAIGSTPSTGSMGIRASFGAVYTDNTTVASGTIASAAIHYLSTPTLAATNASVTASQAATFYIAGPPAAGANMTITAGQSYALQVNSGNIYLGGGIVFANAQTISGNNLTITTGSTSNVGTLTGNWTISSGSLLRSSDGNASNVLYGNGSFAAPTGGSASFPLTSGTSNINVSATGGNLLFTANGVANILTIANNAGNGAVFVNIANSAILANGSNGVMFANSHTVSGAASGNANVSTVTGNLGFRTIASTYTDNISGAGTGGNFAAHAIGTPTLAASNAITSPNLISFYIQSAPTAGTNFTTTPSLYALYVGSGATYLGGNVFLANATTVSGNNMTLTTGSTSNVGTLTGNWTISSGSLLRSSDGNASNVLYGNGAFAATPTASFPLTSGTSNINVSASGGNLLFTANGVANILTVANNAGNGAVFVNIANSAILANGSIGVMSANSITVTGAMSGNANVSTVTGNLGLRTLASTYTDNVAAAASTIANAAIHAIGIPTLTASNAITTTNLSTFYIAGAPVASTNVTATTSYALSVGSGNVYFNNNIVLSGNIIANGTGSNIYANSHTVGGAVPGGNSNATVITATFGLRALGATYTDNAAAASSTIANAAIHAFAAPTLAAANTSVTATNAATLLILGAPVGGANMTITNPYSFFVSAGNSFFGGNVVAAGTNSAVVANSITVSGSTTGSVNVAATLGNLGFRSVAATYTDVAATGTVANAGIHYLAIPTITGGTNAKTYTNFATLYIAGNATAGTNATITNNYALFVASGNSSFNGTVSANVFNATSDRRLKKNIVNIDRPLDLVSNLNGVRYDWIDNNEPSAGLIAQDVEEVMPELVSMIGDGIKTINYNGIIGALVEAVKQLTNRVKVLEQAIKT
jgi:hypothetical protein